MDLHRHVSESSIRPQAYSHLLAYRRDLRRPDFLLTQPVLLDTLRYSLMPHLLHFGRQPGHALAMHSSCPGASSTRSKRRDREALRRISSASCCSAYHLCASPGLHAFVYGATVARHPRRYSRWALRRGLLLWLSVLWKLSMVGRYCMMGKRKGCNFVGSVRCI